MTVGICKKGHALTPDNSITGERKVTDPGGGVRLVPMRQCRRCRLVYRRRLRRAAGINPRRKHETCLSGHAWTPENTITTGTGRRCRICRNQTDRLRHERQRAQWLAAKGQGR
jgi:hypothetical protein